MSTFYPVEIELDGRKHQGQWTLRQGCKLCVGAGYYGARVVDLGDRKTTEVAREVLRELVVAWREAQQPEPAPKIERRPPRDRPGPISVIVDGQAWNGSWCLTAGEVVVSSAYGGRSAPPKRAAPERVAARLMKEIVTAWRAAR
jgi:hypothetical protein